MQDLKEVALADAGADGGAGGLDGLYAGPGGETDGLADFFRLGTTAVAATGGGRREGVGGRGDRSSRLFDPLASFGLGRQDDADGGGAALLASLGLQSAGAQQGQGQLGGLQAGPGVAGVAPNNVGVGGGLQAVEGDAGLSFGGAADDSEWALMQKQFEDMNKSFLRE